VSSCCNSLNVTILGIVRDMIPCQLFTQLSYVAGNHRLSEKKKKKKKKKSQLFYDSLPHRIVVFLVVRKVDRELYLILLL
jgi:hypothetical protein